MTQSKDGIKFGDDKNYAHYPAKALIKWGYEYVNGIWQNKVTKKIPTFRGLLQRCWCNYAEAVHEPKKHR